MHFRNFSLRDSSLVVLPLLATASPIRTLSERMAPWITPARLMDSDIDRVESLIINGSIRTENEQITNLTTKTLSTFSPDQRSELPPRTWQEHKQILGHLQSDHAPLSYLDERLSTWNGDIFYIRPWDKYARCQLLNASFTTTFSGVTPSMSSAPRCHGGLYLWSLSQFPRLSDSHAVKWWKRRTGLWPCWAKGEQMTQGLECHICRIGAKEGRVHGWHRVFKTSDL